MDKPSVLSQSLTGRSLVGPLIVFALALLGFIFEPASSELLGYQRHTFSQGRYWQLLSASFLHTNLNHLLLNLAGMALLWALHGQYYRPVNYLLMFVLLSVASALGVHYYSLELSHYVGLSGALNGLFTWGAIKDIQRGLRTGWLLLIGIIAKVGYEQWQGADAQVASLINAQVAIDAHLFGVLAALGLAAAGLLKQKKP